MLCEKGDLRYLDTEDLNRVISDTPVVPRETTLTYSDSTETGSPVESEIVRVVSVSTMEITDITRFKKKSSRRGYLNASTK